MTDAKTMVPGDVNEDGELYLGSRFNQHNERVDEWLKTGTRMVTLDQATAAEPHGWARSGEPRGDYVLIQKDTP